MEKTITALDPCHRSWDGRSFTQLWKKIAIKYDIASKYNIII